jgi:sensitive to high expression protein 9, mitochondrial
MRPLLSPVAGALLQATANASRTVSRNLRPTGPSNVCLRCQLRTIAHQTRDGIRLQRSSLALGNASISSNRFQSTDSKPTPPGNPASKPASADTEDHIARVSDEVLPSYWEKQRWTLSKRLSVLMDHLQERLAEAGQKVNSYTGTDYSGIAALRQEIKDQGLPKTFCSRNHAY